MAYKAYFDNQKVLWKIASGDSEIAVMDNIYVTINGATTKDLTETQFNDLNQENKIAVLNESNEIVFSDITHPQYTSSTTDTTDAGDNVFTLLKANNTERQKGLSKLIGDYLNNNPSDTNWSTFKSKLDAVDFNDNSIYPLTNGFYRYLHSLTGMPELNILRLP